MHLVWYTETRACDRNAFLKKRKTTASWWPLFPPRPHLPHPPFPLRGSRRWRGPERVQRSPKAGGRTARRWDLSDLHRQNYWWWLNESSEEWCCCTSRRRWDPECQRCYPRCWWRSCGRCCWRWMRGRRRGTADLKPGVGAGYFPGWVWGGWDGRGPGAAWGAGAAAACRSSPPEAGGGSSCERSGIWSCRTSWSEERNRNEVENPNHLLVRPSPEDKDRDFVFS